jgi:uncharacterized protein DUF3467
VDKKKPQQIQLELDKEIAEGTYANLSLIAHSHSEFILDFARLLPGVPKAKVCSRLVMTPQNAKALARTLEMNIRRFEEMHGEIKMPGAQMMPQIDFEAPETKN